MNILEEIVNHRDLGDLVISLYESYDEFGDDKHGLGVRVANLLMDFKGKVEAEYVPSGPRIYSEQLNALLNLKNAEGDFRLKQSKEL